MMLYVFAYVHSIITQTRTRAGQQRSTYKQQQSQQPSSLKVSVSTSSSSVSSSSSSSLSSSSSSCFAFPFRYSSSCSSSSPSDVLRALLSSYFSCDDEMLYYNDVAALVPPRLRILPRPPFNPYVYVSVWCSVLLCLLCSCAMFFLSRLVSCYT
jgi:hypothetical protein